ncbi:MAG: Methyltransferase type 11 [Bacteroidota bacterium]|nr:Methyltransferase type 11 [Bacteroidota bacterium]
MTTASRKWKLAQALEYKWWQNYLQKKDVSKYLDWKRNYWNNLLLSLSEYIEFPVGKNILDAGCGPAGIFMVLSGNTVDALDPLLDRYKSLEHFIPEKYPRINFINASIEALDHEEKYDLIFCMNAINHVNDIELCYDNLVKALKSGGYLIISTDAHRHEFLKKIFQLIPGDVLHPVQLNIMEYNTFLSKRNMETIHDILYKREMIFDYHITIAKKR